MVNLLAAGLQDRPVFDTQTASVEADAAQIRNGQGDTGSAGVGADADDGGDACGPGCRDPGGRVLEHRAVPGRYSQAVCGEEVGIGKGFSLFDVFACDEYARGGEAGRCHAGGGYRTAARRDDCPTSGWA